MNIQKRVKFWRIHLSYVKEVVTKSLKSPELDLIRPAEFSHTINTSNNETITIEKLASGPSH
jgi:hypothetical protein